MIERERGRKKQHSKYQNKYTLQKHTYRKRARKRAMRKLSEKIFCVRPTSNTALNQNAMLYVIKSERNKRLNEGFLENLLFPFTLHWYVLFVVLEFSYIKLSSLSLSLYRCCFYLPFILFGSMACVNVRARMLRVFNVVRFPTVMLSSAFYRVGKLTMPKRLRATLLKPDIHHRL